MFVTAVYSEEKFS